MMRYMEDDDDDVDINEEVPTPAQPLIDSINLNDLLSGQEVVFKISKDCDDVIDFLDDTKDDKSNGVFSQKVRTVRSSPGPNTSFSSIASGMVSLDPQGYVKKEVIHQGTGMLAPEHSRVTVHYVFYKEYDDEPFDSTYHRGTPTKLYLGQGEVIPGLELAIRSMKKNEHSRFLIKWEVAFGQQGCLPRIGKECDILADVTLLDFIQLYECVDANGASRHEVNGMSFAQSMREAKSLHMQGNDDFNSGRIKSAISSYRKSVKVLHNIWLRSDEDEKTMLALKVKCLVNLAVCFNKIGRYQEACLACRDVFSMDPNNVKAIFQYGRANLHLSNFKLAEKWLMKAKSMKPFDADIVKELERLHTKKETAQLEDMAFCQRAFGNTNSMLKIKN